MKRKYEFNSRRFIILILVSFLVLNFFIVNAQDNQSSIVIVYFEFLNSSLKTKGNKTDTSHFVMFTKEGDLSMKYLYKSSNSVYTLSSTTYDNRGRICGFQSGEMFIPTIIEDTLFRSKKKYFMPQYYISPNDIKYECSGHDITETKIIQYGNGTLFIISNCLNGNMILKSISLTNNLSMNLSINVNINVPNIYFIGAFRIVNPPLKVINDLYYMSQKEPSKIDTLKTPNEKDILNFLKESKKIKEWDSFVNKRLSEIN